MLSSKDAKDINHGFHGLHGLYSIVYNQNREVFGRLMGYETADFLLAFFGKYGIILVGL
jgi:hypothetical protein